MINPQLLNDASVIARLHAKDPENQRTQVLEEFQNKNQARISLDNMLHNQKIKQQQLLKSENKKELLDELTVLKNEILLQEQIADNLEKSYEEKALNLVNIPHSTVPLGLNSAENCLIKTVEGYTTNIQKDHTEIFPELMDFEKATNVSGKRFVFLKGKLAKLSRCLINFMLDQHTNNGYLEINVPLLVNPASMVGTGQFPKFKAEAFTTTDNKILIPTAEVPLTNMHRNSILKESLPINYCAYSSCFRSEAGAAGKDEKGMIRMHQFEKVELVKFVAPEFAMQELDKMLADAASILELLNLPYRIVELCTGDLGFSSEKTYDIEVWLPSQQKYREISSVSSCGDFQARRAMIRYKDQGKNKYVNTLNGSGVAVGRLLVAILENYQQPDGKVLIPQALQADRYMNCESI